MPDTMAKLKLAQQKIETLLAARDKLVKDAFHEGARVLFKAHPILKRFQWTQYTPHYNDGDTCHFTVNRDRQFDFGSGDLEELTYYDWDPRTQKSTTRDTPKTRAGHAVGEFLELFNDDMLEEMFGDHKEITVTSEGVEVGVYDHA